MTVTGDGQAALTRLRVNFCWRDANDSLTLNKVIANSIGVSAENGNDSVTLEQSTVNGPLRVRLGRDQNDQLTVDHSTIIGNVVVDAHAVKFDHATIDGSTRAWQRSSNSLFDPVDSTFTGNLTDFAGRGGTINLHPSVDGPNHIEGRLRIIGIGREAAVLNTSTGSSVVDGATRLFHTDARTVNGPSSPTVKSVTSGAAPSAVTGTWDSNHAQQLVVTVGSNSFQLGKDAQLTATGANWSLSLAGVNLALGANTVTAVNTDSFGNRSQGTGTVTLTTDRAQLAAIHTYLTANNLTATQTPSGLNYVITTKGSGAVPTKGKTVTVNYSGLVLNANGTLGAEFDSNVDAQFKHVQPFQFVLGSGQVIPGWDEAFALLPVGTKAKLLIPSALGYGSTSKPGIPANSILEFDVTFVS